MPKTKYIYIKKKQDKNTNLKKGGKTFYHQKITMNIKKQKQIKRHRYNN